MKPIKVALSADFKQIEIIPVADYHWGDPNSDHKRIKEDLEYIRTHDNVFCILNGDLINSAIKSSVSNSYEGISPMEELRVCEELFEPIKDKILCVVPGNHERRISKETSIDITELMCRQLGIEERYSHSTALLFIRFGQQNSVSHFRKVLYTIYVSHGSGGGRREGGKIQRLVDLSTIVDADIFVCGHTHLPAILKDSFARPHQATNSVTYCTRLYVNTSAKLTYDGGYGEIGGFKPPCLETPVIYLNGTKKEMRAKV